MKIAKKIALMALTISFLISCGSSKSIKDRAIPVMDNLAVDLPAKKSKIDEETFKHWAHKDLATDTIPGISLKKAYEFLEGKKSHPVIVGVIDSGIDIEHEDLKDVLWMNPKEVAGNKIDDDKNGYIDDVYGWNFLGGDRVDAPEQLEITRLYAHYDKKFGNKKESDIRSSQKEDYKKYLSYKKDFENKSKEHFDKISRLKHVDLMFQGVKKILGKNDFTLEDLSKHNTKDYDEQALITSMAEMYRNGVTKKGFYDYYENLKRSKNYDIDFDGRAIVGDDPENINDTSYGNGVVIGSKSIESHGTHVAGIILANRNNGIGMMGVANHAKLMSIRAVPDGDERDKDIALAIRYAVDNGAKVINMSFGKGYSPNKEWVFDAIKYAAEKDVLLVHAAGNSKLNIDEEDNFPNDAEDKINEFADNMITVGALSSNYDENLLATFSNYGKKNVDIFAPGVQIYSTVPKNDYEKFSGTSMASPEVAGVATLIRSYYPELSAKQVKHIIMNSGVPIPFKVKVPGTEEKKKLEEISVSGRILNAYNALVLANKVVYKK